VRVPQKIPFLAAPPQLPVNLQKIHRNLLANSQPNNKFFRKVTLGELKTENHDKEA
jgi:hypothetical protein